MSPFVFIVFDMIIFYFTQKKKKKPWVYSPIETDIRFSFYFLFVTDIEIPVSIHLGRHTQLGYSQWPYSLLISYLIPSALIL